MSRTETAAEMRQRHYAEEQERRVTILLKSVDPGDRPDDEDEFKTATSQAVVAALTKQLGESGDIEARTALYRAFDAGWRAAQQYHRIIEEN